MYVQIIKYMTGKFKAKYINKKYFDRKTLYFNISNVLFDNYVPAIQFPTYYTDHINFNA